ncbi:MAG: hypothetical protein K5984_05710 [Bacteroidales bacterium]|nr:hypothetical protein [Bacteroidales bacterium]
MKKTIVISLLCLIGFCISAQTKDYYSGLRQPDTIFVNNTNYRTSRYPSFPNFDEYCRVYVTNTNNYSLIRQLYKARNKETGTQVGGYYQEKLYRYNLFTKTTAAKALLEQVFSNEERLSLTSQDNFLRLELFVDKYGNVCGVGFCFEYTDDDKTILAISPEKLAAIESLLIEKLKIDLKDDKEEVSSSERRMQLKKFIYEKCDFVYLRTYLYVSFNGNDIVVTREHKK